MLAAMPWPVLNEWKAFNQVEPLDPADRLEFMLAQLTALTANLWKSKSSQAATVMDFIPRREPRKKARDLWAELKAWALSFKKD
jgi:hypothetical protein